MTNQQNANCTTTTYNGGA
jgi:hypothetical protein